MDFAVEEDVESGLGSLDQLNKDASKSLQSPPPIWRVHPLLGTMWKTKNARFHAADRLRSRSWWKGIALSVLSAYVLVLSVVPKFIEVGGADIHRDYIGLVVLTASILILVFSIMSLFDEDKLRYNYMRDNAKDISSLYHHYKLEVGAAAKSGSDLPSPEPVNAKYQLLIEKCPFNHDPVDWLKATIDIEQEEKHPVGFMKARLALWMFYDIYFWPLTSVLITIIPSWALWTHM